MMYSFSSLKEQQGAIQSGFSSDLSLRVHRCLSWLNRAELAAADDDAAFIFLWVSFNAAYAEEIEESAMIEERSVFCNYFQKLTKLDSENQIYDAIWEKFSQSVRVFLDNRYVFQPFWKYQNKVAGHEDWQKRFDRKNKRFKTALECHETCTALELLFERLYVLRNQLVHGGATWNGSVNRDQVRDGAKILGFLVPVFVNLMMDNPNVDWGQPYYPIVD